MSNNRPPDDEFKVKRWYKQRLDMRKKALYTRQPRILLPRPDPHYHLLYNSKPDFTIGYETQNLAVRAMRKVVDKHIEAKGEDKAIFYEDMPVIQLVECPIKGRTGLHRVMIQVGVCPNNCAKIIKVVTPEDRQ